MTSKNRGAQRGVNGAARRSDAANRVANADYRATGRVDSPAQRNANRAADGLARLRAVRRDRG